VITPEIRAEIRRLIMREGWQIETVARRFAVHHSVVRRALNENAAPSEREPRPSKLDPYKDYIVRRLAEHPEMTATRLHKEIQKQGYTLSVQQLRRYVARVRVPRSRKVYLRVEVEPGEQAQVDWGSFGTMRVGATQRPLSAFMMVLSWSRALYVDFSLDQKLDTFLRMHQRALQFFGGVPRQVLYDNLKSVVLHHIGTTVQFNPRFLLFAGHYLFEPVAAPVRYPEAKGRVENAIKYLRQSFFYGRSFGSLVDLRAQAAAWRDETANTRLHRTTRERPDERLRVERTRLHPLPARPYDADLVVPTIVTKEARVHLDANTYSVPHQFAGKSVHVRADDHTVRVFFERTEIARHVRCWDRRRAIEDPAHREALLERRPAARGPSRRDRIAGLAPECRLYLQEIARRRIDLDSEIRKLVRLVERYGETEVAGGMARALAARSFGARYVHTLIDQSRFARGLGEPPEPIITGNPAADSLDVQPHDLETYDAIGQHRQPRRSDATDE
jgi:transposase